MRKIGNLLVWLAAAAVCALMTWITLGSGISTIIYNLSVLGVMILIILIAVIIGFHRIGRTVRGLDRASGKLMAAYRDRSELANITRSDAEIFEVSYLDRKYQEYLGFLRKTNSPCDISDYIGEYEINNYIHRRMIEMVPDILTSLGILGTFVGLVLGLRGFNPVSYEAMATSITSLVEGIKVAFVTSIYGIALSMAFSYSLRGAVSSVSESLDNFTDKYYVCAVPPTDATAMNHVLANQKENTRAIQEMGSQIGDQVGRAVTEQVTPVLDEMQRSLDHFTQVMTLNQQEMLEKAMKKEFIAEFLEMRALLKETNKAQESFLEYTEKAQGQLEENLRLTTREIGRATSDSAASQKEAMNQIRVQQQHLTEFVEYMNQVMQAMVRMNETHERALKAMAGQVEAMEETANAAQASALAASRSVEEAARAAREAAVPTVNNRIEDLDELTDRLDRVIALMEKQQKAQQKKRSIFG